MLALAKKGGQATSWAKVVSARANGKKGGRPRKVVEDAGSDRTAEADSGEAQDADRLMAADGEASSHAGI